MQVVTVARAGRRSRATVPHVLGASRAATPRPRAAPTTTSCSQRTVRRLAGRFGSTSGIYVQNLATGAGAAWNARATFPAASALKLAIAVTALARTEGTPPPGSTLDRLLRQMLTYSDNAAANATERYFGGSTSGRLGARQRADAVARARRHGDVRRLRARRGRRDLARARRRRSRCASTASRTGGAGKKTSAYDLGSLLRAVWLASGGRGPLRAAQPGFTPSDARYLLYLLAHVRDPGKIDRVVGRLPGVRVLHKAGWINDARHDNGIVLWPGGALVVTVMTYRVGAAPGLSSDVLAGDVAAAALRRFRG